VHLACKGRANQGRIKRRKVKSKLRSGVQRRGAHPATMLIEMSAALAEWVSAPTLMKSTPVWA